MLEQGSKNERANAALTALLGLGVNVNYTFGIREDLGLPNAVKATSLQDAVLQAKRAVKGTQTATRKEPSKEVSAGYLIAVMFDSRMIAIFVVNKQLDPNQLEGCRLGLKLIPNQTTAAIPIGTPATA